MLVLLYYGRSDGRLVCRLFTRYIELIKLIIKVLS